MSLMSPSTRTLSSLRHLTTKKLPLKKPFSTGTNRIPLPRTPHPHQYELILSHPTFPNPAGKTTTTRRSTFSDSEPSFEDWVDKKLAHPSKNVHVPGMDKKKREYYNQRRKALYGEDSDDEREKRMKKGEFVELVPEVVEFKSLHEKEEELYFYDAIIVPWEKDKHYRMVYQLENKFFPGQGMDNAFLPGEKWGTNANRKAKPKAKDNVIAIHKHEYKDKDKDKDKKKDDNLVFFGEKDKEGMRVDLSLKKVGEFFKGLRKKYNITNNINKKDLKAVEGLDEGLGLDEPFLATRTTGLPVTWDSPGGTVVLVNKPKGWTSFTVCGKLRRLTNVRKVGHAGTLDPMATGLLIVCVGRATKIVDSYQGMVKGYSGTFRLGEATSTWDADSPVIQREPWEHVKDSDIKKAVASFRGEIWQVPPMFSAIKVGGEKMYDKARRGESIELSPRRISILKFDVERSLEDRQNLIFRVTCSKGTYIRSLCADLGKALGSCAHLTALRRDSIGDYSADDAFNFEELETLVTKKYV